MSLAEKINIPEAQNLRVANAGVFLLTIIALPFDNALFHISCFFLLVTVLLTAHASGWATVRQSIEKVQTVHLAFLGILVLMVLSNLVNGQGSEAWSSTVKFALRYWLMLTALLYLLDQKFLTLRFIFIAALCAVILQVLPFLPIIFDGSIFGYRFAGFTHGPNVIGFYLAIGLVLCLKLSLHGSLGRYMNVVVAILMSGPLLLALLATGSRGSWVAFVGATLAFFVFYASRRPFALASLLVFFSAVGGAALSAFSTPLSRLNLLLEGYPSLRDEVWLNALAQFLEKPIMGHGLDTRAAMMENHFVYTEHNIILSIVTTLGLAGLIAYGNMVYQIIAPAVRARNVFPLIMVFLIFIAGMFSFDFYRNQAFMVTFVVIACACLQPAQDSQA